MEYKGYEEAVKPAIKWLAENCHPHMKIIIDSTNAELVEGKKMIRTEEYLKD